ncbi:hypothetical protein C4579_03440 [Candidatus Microgenomates bacterium]|nr:MAG: hypothetical protein C4579_03440 [Candidatus Microgenomates bacterium]
MFTVVTHKTPDLDAITATWLIKRFLPNWQDAIVAFVPAGKTLKNEPADSDPHVWHVDTGFGQLDHHQSDEYTCAAKKTYEYLMNHVSRGQVWENEALARIVEVVNFMDHFREVTLSDANADYHMFHAAYIIDGFKVMYPQDDQKILDLGFAILDGIYKVMQEKVWAEEIMEKEGIKFETPWGKGIAFETLNDTVLKIAQKSGYAVAIRKDPHKKYVRIKGTPETAVDFTKAYEAFKKKDPQATWFLHSSKKILLNGTTKNPDMRPTKLTLEEVIAVLKK